MTNGRARPIRGMRCWHQYSAAAAGATVSGGGGGGGTLVDLVWKWEICAFSHIPVPAPLATAIVDGARAEAQRAAAQLSAEVRRLGSAAPLFTAGGAHGKQGRRPSSDAASVKRRGIATTAASIANNESSPALVTFDNSDVVRLSGVDGRFTKGNSR